MHIQLLLICVYIQELNLNLCRRPHVKKKKNLNIKCFFSMSFLLINCVFHSPSSLCILTLKHECPSSFHPPSHSGPLGSWSFSCFLCFVRKLFLRPCVMNTFLPSNSFVKIYIDLCAGLPFILVPGQSPLSKQLLSFPFLDSCLSSIRNKC